MAQKLAVFLLCFKGKSFTLLSFVLVHCFAILVCKFEAGFDLNKVLFSRLKNVGLSLVWLGGDPPLLLFRL